MPCYNPITAYKGIDGGLVFTESKRNQISHQIQIPCGKCIGCRLERTRQWAIRCVHEAQMHETSSFITLTYNDENFPKDGNLDYKDFQKFMYRLRSHYRRNGVKVLGKIPKISYYMAAEYGELGGRPHFHACLFGIDFIEDRVIHKNASAQEHCLYQSKTLDDLWKKGYASIGQVTMDSASYVAGYIMKKITGDMAQDHYKRTRPDGSTYQLTPEFNRMSLKPAIGKRWVEKWTDDMTDGNIVMNGKLMAAPKAYKRFLEDLGTATQLDRWESTEMKQQLAVKDPKRLADNTDARLAVKETVATAKQNRYKNRSL
jgi:hypothetical protein